MIKPETVERVRSETDIVELIGSFLPLKKVGRNFRGLCPFHPDRSPSFYVSPDRQTYHCFGCGAGGNAVGFIMAQEKLAFPEAVRFLANRLGIEVLEEAVGPNQSLYEACEQAAVFYEKQLAGSDEAKAYLEKRGLKPETVKRFRLGFAPSGGRLRVEARKRSWSEQGLVRTGLLVKREQGLADYFYDRIMFPIFSLSGKVIGFGGRVLDDQEPKYLNSPDTEIFRKGYNLYGAFQAKGYLRSEPPILVEGNFDLLTLVDAGINNVVAPLGTALTPSQALLLARHNRRVTVCFDGDAAGRQAARRSLEVLLRCGLDPQMVLLAEGADPDEYVREHGAEAFRELVGQATGFIEFVLAGRNLRNVAEERSALRELVSLLRLVPDQSTRELYANELAARFKVAKSTVLADVVERAAPRQTAPGVRLAEEKVLAAAIQSQELARIVRDFCLADTVEDEKLRAVAELVSELCDEPGFGPASLLDRIGDEDTRKRVAGWTFAERALPDPAEFECKVRRLRAAWLHRRVVAAYEAGNQNEAEMLVRERTELLREAARERSTPR